MGAGPRRDVNQRLEAHPHERCPDIRTLVTASHRGSCRALGRLATRLRPPDDDRPWRWSSGPQARGQLASADIQRGECKPTEGENATADRNTLVVPTMVGCSHEGRQAQRLLRPRPRRRRARCGAPRRVQPVRVAGGRRRGQAASTGACRLPERLGSRARQVEHRGDRQRRAPSCIFPRCRPPPDLRCRPSCWIQAR